MNSSLFELKSRLLFFSKRIEHIAKNTLDPKTVQVLEALYLKANLRGLANMLRYHAGDITKLGHVQAQSYWCWIDAAYFYLEAATQKHIDDKMRAQKLSFVVDELNQLELFINAQADLFGLVPAGDSNACTCM